MVVACQGYITDDGSVKVWDLPPTLLLQRITACKNLYSRYQESFMQTKAKSQEILQGEALEVSEMYVFGKFKSFCNRLDNIRLMVESIQAFSALSQSNIEGIDHLNSRFQGIFSIARKKNYNILDPRKHEFDTDFADFMRQIAELEVHTQTPHHHTHTYVHTHTDTYLRTQIHTYVHRYIPMYTDTYLRTQIHTYVHRYIRTYTETYVPMTHVHRHMQTQHTHTHRNKSMPNTPIGITLTSLP